MVIFGRGPALEGQNGGNPPKKFNFFPSILIGTNRVNLEVILNNFSSRLQSSDYQTFTVGGRGGLCWLLYQMFKLKSKLKLRLIVTIMLEYCF